MGTAVFATYFMFGRISGGHFNPAVTMGVFVRENKDFRINASKMLKMVTSQIFGGLFGVFIVWLGLTMNHSDDFGYTPRSINPCRRPSDCHYNYFHLYPIIVREAEFEDLKHGKSNDSGDFVLHSIWRTFLTEMLMTFMFVSVVLNLKYLNGHIEDITNSAAIGLAFTAMFVIS